MLRADCERVLSCAAAQVHAQLSAKYPGVIVPPLPEKQSATVQTMRVSGVGFSAEWLEERRSQLQRFVQRVVR